jgi:hypothetical protein
MGKAQDFIKLVESTICYGDGGDTWYGEEADHPIDYWLKVGKEKGQKYLYKGFRYYEGKKDQVVVFDTKRWDAPELRRRKKNGFFGIKIYVIG